MQVAMLAFYHQDRFGTPPKYHVMTLGWDLK
jgi:hypothetical protein